MTQARMLMFLAAALGSSVNLIAQQNPAKATVASVVVCSSADQQRHECQADTSAGAVMLRQTSAVNCLLGRNWGYDAQGIWVTEGCGGEFGTGSTSPQPGPPHEETALVEQAGDGLQEKAVTTGTNPLVHYTGYFQPYGSLRAVVAITDAGAEVQDDASRIGINFTTHGAVKVFATGELGWNLVTAESTLNPGATTSDGFGVLNSVTQPVFGGRLGYIGVDFGSLGKISFGKQLSTHYNVADYTTDQFNVFGGQASATYVANTDGGQSGTGRADQTILYTNTFAKIFQFGAQGQLRTAATPQAFNGFGFSLQAKVLPWLKLGGAYNKTYFQPDLARTVLHGPSSYWIFGAQGNWRNLQYGATWARQINGDLAFVPDPDQGPIPIPVGFTANGVELFSRLTFGKFAFLAGLNDYNPRNLSPLINPDFRIRYAILGAEWHFSESGYTFVEARLGDSIDAEGHGGQNAAAVGFRYDFSLNTPHTQ